MVCEALMLVEVVRVSELLLRLRVEDEIMPLSVELVAVCKADGSSSDVPLTDSSCAVAVADAPVVMPSLATRRSSRIWLDRVLRGDVESAATRRAVSRETLDTRIVMVGG